MNDLSETYLVPKYYYNLLKNVMSSSQVEDLQRYNKEEPSASAEPNATLDISETDMTSDPTNPKQNKKKPTNDAKDDAKDDTISNNKETDVATPITKKVLSESLFSTPEAKTPQLKHNNGWYVCEICNAKEHGKKKFETHMLTHNKTSTPLSPIKKPAAYVKFQ